MNKRDGSVRHSIGNSAWCFSMFRGSRRLEGKEVSRCHTCARIATAFPQKITFGGFQLGRSTAAGGVRFVE